MSHRWFDPKCGELAAYFLGERASQRLLSELAAEIQQSIEDWLEHEKHKIEQALTSEERPQ